MGASQSAGLTATQANAAAIPTSGAAAAMRPRRTRGVSSLRVPPTRRAERPDAR